MSRKAQPAVRLSMLLASTALLMGYSPMTIAAEAKPALSAASTDANPKRYPISLIMFPLPALLQVWRIATSFAYPVAFCTSCSGWQDMRNWCTSGRFGQAPAHAISPSNGHNVRKIGPPRE